MKKKKSDIISNLPENIVEKILVYLPLKEAVRTSVLSTKWRYKWAFIPKLVFNVEYCPDSKNELYKLLMFFDRVLLFHRGPIQKFELNLSSMKRLKSSSTMFQETDRALDTWLQLILSRNDVKKFKLLPLFIDGDGDYEVPSVLFSCQAISSLNLIRCFLNPPPSFQGFRNLKTLKLDSFDIPNETIFENMISNSVVLEKLSLTYHLDPFRLKIRAPNLQYFYFEGVLSDLYFLDVPHLAYVIIILDEFQDEDKDKAFKPKKNHLINVFGCLTGIKKLEIFGCFLEFMAIFPLKRTFRLPILFKHLKKLSLVVEVESWKEMLITSILLENAPNLQELEIYVYSDTEDFKDDFSKSGLDFSTNSLNIVKIRDFSGTQIELEFIEILLANSPLLDVLSITPASKESMVVQKLLGFQRASATAKIHYGM